MWVNVFRLTVQFSVFNLHRFSVVIIPRLIIPICLLCFDLNEIKWQKKTFNSNLVGTMFILSSVKLGFNSYRKKLELTSFTLDWTFWMHYLVGWLWALFNFEMKLYLKVEQCLKKIFYFLQIICNKYFINTISSVTVTVLSEIRV